MPDATAYDLAHLLSKNTVILQQPHQLLVQFEVSCLLRKLLAKGAQLAPHFLSLLDRLASTTFGSAAQMLLPHWAITVYALGVSQTSSQVMICVLLVWILPILPKTVE